MKLKSIGLLVLAHTAIDINQGAIPVLLPFFIAEHHISYAAAASVVFAINIASSIAQPIFGHIADRRSRPWLIPAAMLCAGLGVSLMGWMPSFHSGVLVVGLSGLGMAAFHPEGARMVYRLAGDRKATAMSFFAIGGQLGFAIGPLIATGAMLVWGLRGSISLVVPTTIVALLVTANFTRATNPAETGAGASRDQESTTAQDVWIPFILLSAIMLTRSVVFYGLNTFLPLFWINVLHQSKGAAGMSLTIFMVSSILGNLLGGRMADRFGYRIMAVSGFVCLAVLIPLFARVESPLQALLLLIPIGIMLSIPTSPLVVLGQGYLPNRVGLASGVTLGLAFSFGGVMTPALGWIADHHGLHAAISIVAYLPIACIVLAFTLPRLKTAEAGGAS